MRKECTYMQHVGRTIAAVSNEERQDIFLFPAVAVNRIFL